MGRSNWPVLLAEISGELLELERVFRVLLAQLGGRWEEQTLLDFVKVNHLIWFRGHLAYSKKWEGETDLTQSFDKKIRVFCPALPRFAKRFPAEYDDAYRFVQALIRLPKHNLIQEMKRVQS